VTPLSNSHPPSGCLRAINEPLDDDCQSSSKRAGFRSCPRLPTWQEGYRCANAPASRAAQTLRLGLREPVMAGRPSCLGDFVINWPHERCTGMSRIYPPAFTVTLALVLLCACGSTAHMAAQTSPSPATLACTSSGQASSSWPAPSTRSGSAPPIISATVAQDTFKLTFDSGTPAFELTPQSSAHFNADSGLGQPIDLAGSAGLLIVLRGFRGDMDNYAGPVSFTSQGPLLVQVKSLGGSEGQASWAAGLSRPGCARVTSTGATLTFHFIPSP
jgi:hypothetical protein